MLRPARISGLALLVAVAAGSAPVTAQSVRDKTEARNHANAGRELFRAGDYDQAVTRFEQAEAIIHAPPHLLYIARAHRAVGRLLQAREVYRKLAAEEQPEGAPRAFKAAAASAAAELQEVDAQIPKLAIVVDEPPGAAASVSLDGSDVSIGEAPIDVDPGDHRVSASADGYRDAYQQVQVTAGAGVVEVKLSLEPVAAEPVQPPPTPPDGSGLGISVPPLVLLGAGVAFTAVGAITGTIALGKASELRDACPSNPCPSEREGLADDANLLATVSTIGLLVGGLALAGGATWLVFDLTAGDDEAADGDVAAAALLGPGFVGLRGRF